MNQIEFYEAKPKNATDSWDLFEDLKDRKGIVLVDVRSKHDFDLKHIPTTINIPHATMSECTTCHLDKTNPGKR